MLSIAAVGSHYYWVRPASLPNTFLIFYLTRGSLGYTSGSFRKWDCVSGQVFQYFLFFRIKAAGFVCSGEELVYMFFLIAPVIWEAWLYLLHWRKEGHRSVKEGPIYKIAWIDRNMSAELKPSSFCSGLGGRWLEQIRDRAGEYASS